ncbi:MAG: 50S ribosomal protein L4 [Candidatus Babeliales bacterium]
MMNKENQKSKEKSNSAEVITAQILGMEKPVKLAKFSSFSNWIHILRQNWRQGTVGCKGRSDVVGSTKKPWKQKGTGRARAGSVKSPIWRGGGVIFGPQPRVRTLKIAKKLKKGVLKSIFFDFLNSDKFLCINWQVQTDKPSTAAAYELLKKLDLINKKITLFVPLHDKLTYASFSNIPQVRILYFDQLNAFDLTDSRYLLVLKKDFEEFKKALSWI